MTPSPTIRKRMKQLDVTIYRMAADVGCARSTIHRILRGERMSVKMAIRFGRYLGVKPAVLLAEEAKYHIDILEADVPFVLSIQAIPKKGKR